MEGTGQGQGDGRMGQLSGFVRGKGPERVVVFGRDVFADLGEEEGAKTSVGLWSQE